MTERVSSWESIVQFSFINITIIASAAAARQYWRPMQCAPAFWSSWRRDHGTGLSSRR